MASGDVGRVGARVASLPDRVPRTTEVYMSGLVYVNGEYHPKERAGLSVFDHGFLYGDGVFEGIRVYGGRCFRLNRHLERLWDSARSIRLVPCLKLEKLSEAVKETVAKNDIVEGYVRLLLTRGTNVSPG